MFFVSQMSVVVEEVELKVFAGGDVLADDQVQINKKFLLAATKKGVADVVQALKSGAATTYVDSNGRNALSLVAVRGDENAVPIAKILLQHDRAAVFAPDHTSGKNALHKAALYGSPTMVELLLMEGGKRLVNLADLKGMSALHLCVLRSDEVEAIQIAKLLLANGANKNSVASRLLRSARFHGPVVAGARSKGVCRRCQKVWSLFFQEKFCVVFLFFLKKKKYL
jgi:ankyrin repeat protein